MLESYPERKCALYIRDSTDRQANEGESLEKQEKRLREFCKSRNWIIVKVYREEGKSGKDANRPQFQNLLHDRHLSRILMKDIGKTKSIPLSIKPMIGLKIMGITIFEGG